MRERDVEAYLKARIHALGGLCLKWTSPGRRNVPDRLVFLPGGRLELVELKAPGRLPTVGQLREHRRLSDLGFIVLVIDSPKAVDGLYPLP